MPTGGFTLPPKTLASIDISEAAAAGMKRVVVLDDNTIAVVDDQGVAHPAADLSAAVLKEDLGTPNNPPALDNDGVMRGLVSVRHGTKAEIDAMVLNDGEIALVDDAGVVDVRTGDGTTLGGKSLRKNLLGIDLITKTTLPSADPKNKVLLPVDALIINFFVFYNVVLEGLDRDGYTARNRVHFYFLNIHNAYTITIKHQDTNAAVNDRFICEGGTDIILGQHERAEIMVGSKIWAKKL